MTDPILRSGVAGLDRVTFDVGLRMHMQRVFGYMSGGLVMTGILAWIASQPPFAQALFGSPLRWLVMLAPMGFVMAMSFRMQTVGVTALKTMFWLFCATMG